MLCVVLTCSIAATTWCVALDVGVHLHVFTFTQKHTRQSDNGYQRLEPPDIHTTDKVITATLFPAVPLMSVRPSLVCVAIIFESGTL